MSSSTPQHNLVLSDCLEWMRQQPAGGIRGVVTSPPYNIGTAYRAYRDDRPRQEYLSWLREVFTEVRRVLADDGHVFLNVGCSNKDPWVDLDVAQALRDILVLQNRFLWVKSIYVNDKTHGHFKPITSSRFVHLGQESVFHFTKAGGVKLDRLAVGVPYEWESNLARFNKTKPAGQKVRCRGNTWFVPYDTIQDRTIDRGAHPATFPVELASMCIKIAGLDQGSTVFDPFVGTGTTVIAAQGLGMLGIGTDIDPGYLDYARRRLQAVLGSDPSSTSNPARSR